MLEHCHCVVYCASTVTTSQVVPDLLKVVLKLIRSVGALTEVQYLGDDILFPIVQKFEVCLGSALLY